MLQGSVASVLCLTHAYIKAQHRMTRSCRIAAFGVRRDKAALFQWVQAPPGNPLQPEATGATMEVTTWLEPSGKRVTRYGDSASVQAVTRVNAEQASKRTMHRPTRLPYRGRLTRLG
jgi:hypothetical protein